MTLDIIKKACSQYRRGKCNIDHVDIKKERAIAVRDQIFAIPTLVKLSPGSLRKYIGTFKSVKYIDGILNNE